MKTSEEVKTIVNWGMWRVFSNADGEIDGLVHASVTAHTRHSLSQFFFSTAFN